MDLAVDVFIMRACWTLSHILSTGHHPQIFLTK